jgi:two-component system, sensor histidine kinase
MTFDSPDAARLAALVRHLSLGTLVEDEHRRVVLANQRFCDLFGINAPPAALVGGDCAAAAEAVKGLFRDPEAFVQANIECLRALRPVAGQILVMADGRVLERDYAPIEEGGRFLGHLWTYRDVSEVRAAEQALAASEERLRLAIEGAELGTYDMDLPSGRVEVNAHYMAAFGYAPGDLVIDNATWRRWLHPDDAKATVAAFTAHIRGQSPTFQVEYRLRHRDGSWVWISDRGQVLEFDSTGAPVRFCGTHLDITERKAAELAAQAARGEAEQAAAAREQFLATVSHELRTPLNAVVGLAHLLERTALSEAQQRSLHGIQYAADVLLGVVNDLLDLTRMRSGRLTIEATPFAPQALLTSLADAQRAVASARGLELVLELGPDLPQAVLGDPVRVNQILLNLVGNAIKFTEHGRVTLRADRVADDTAPGTARLCFEVRDTGIGIAPEYRERIFGTFQQATPDTSRRYGGSGLGLAIVRELTQRMAGSIELESARGVGSTFRVSIPFAVSEALPTVTDVGAPVHLGGAHILLVEDNVLNRDVARRILEDAGARVSTAVNGREAVEQVQAGAFDLVLMDIQMPEMDGFEASWRIRHDLGISARELPIVALTATALTDEHRRAEAAGMSDYILKPFRPEALLRRVRALTGAGRRPSREFEAEELSGFVRTLDAMARTGEFPVAVASVGGAGSVDEDRPGDGQVDPMVLRRLSQLPGSDDRDLATELVESFAARVPSVLDELRAFGLAGDSAGVARTAHSLRGAALQLGAGPFAELARRLEAAAQVGDLDDYDSAVALMASEWPIVAAALRAACGPRATPRPSTPAP